jgi:uncharacterized membrane protein YagU involved in acid resistance
MSRDAATSRSISTKKRWNTILKATLIAGSLDIVAALLMFFIKTEKNPVLVLKYIASAVMGKSAYSDGFMMPLLGLIFHFLVAFAWATIFFFLYPRIKTVIKHSIVAGLLYGIAVWLAMNLLVLPLTQLPKASFTLSQALIGMVVLMLAIGLPIALIVANYYRRSKALSN